MVMAVMKTWISTNMDQCRETKSHDKAWSVTTHCLKQYGWIQSHNNNEHMITYCTKAVSRDLK